MTLPAPQISAPGLTDDQVKIERTWLAGFTQAAETLDWAKWEKWWANDAFMQFGNLPRIYGRDAIAISHEKMFSAFEYLQHEFTRYSFDVPLGLIYQTSTVIFRVKGDPERREIRVPGLAVIHKQMGESQANGCEVYIDSSPAMSVVHEVRIREGATV